MIGILLADPSERIVANLTRRLSDEADMVICGSTADGERTFQEVLRLQPDVVVVDAALPGMDGVQTTEMLAQYAPRTGVILMSMESENDLFRRAMLAGAREVLQKPFKGDDLVAAIRRVHAFQARKATATSSAARASAGSDGSASSRNGQHRGQLITILAGKGGVGKSVIATNLAVFLARSRPGAVVLVDLSLQFGDVAALLDVKSERSIADLAAHDAVADRESIQEVLGNGPEGLRVLAAPSSPELADYVTTAHLRALLTELRSSDGIVVADTSSQLSEITLEAMESADHVVVLTDYSVTSVKNTRLLLSVTGVLHLDPSRITLAANHREPAGAGLDRARIEGFLGVPVALEIPHDPLMPASVDRGTPLVVSHPQSPVAAAIARLAGLIGAEGEAADSPGDSEAKPRSGRARIFRR